MAKQSKDGLREKIDASSLLAALLERSSTPMLVADDDRLYIEANAAACELLGYSRDQLLTMTVEEISPPELASQAPEMFERFKKEGTMEGPFTVVDADGKNHQVQFSATANVLPGAHLSIFVESHLVDEALDADKRTVDGETDGSPNLSTREREVLTLLALGETNQTIAEKLHLAPETVRNYTRSARAKLGARSRSQAIAIAVASGQLDLDGS